MSVIKKIKSLSAQDFLMILLLFSVVPIVSFFIVFYSGLFSGFALLAQRRLEEHPFLSFILTPTLFWFSAFICRKFAQNASGSSIGHVKDAINELQKSPDSFSKVSIFLSFRILITNFFSSLICVFGGGALGKEGPAIQMAASFFTEIGEKTKNSFTKIKSESWVFIGIGVGLTTAFSAPIAGFIYVLEKSTKAKIKYFQLDIIWSLTAILIVVLTLGKTSSLFGEINVLSKPQEALFWLALTILSCAIIAKIFVVISHYFYIKFIAVKSNSWHLIPISCGFAVVTISYFCGIHSFTDGMTTVNHLLNSNSNVISEKEVFGRIINSFLTFISGAAGGLVAPAISMGNGIGFFISDFATNIDRNLFLLVGMTSFLAVILGEPFAAAAIIFELTGRQISLLPLFLTSSLFAITIDTVNKDL